MVSRLKIVGQKMVRLIWLTVFHQSRLNVAEILCRSVAVIFASIHAEMNLSRLQKSCEASWFLRRMFRNLTISKGLCRFSKLAWFLWSAFWQVMFFIWSASLWINFVFVGQGFWLFGVLASHAFCQLPKIKLCVKISASWRHCLFSVSESSSSTAPNKACTRQVGVCAI